MCFKRMKVILIVCIVVQLLSTGFTFAYSRNNAILYADNYSQSPNQMNSLGQGYNFYGWGSDCANFASQCMNAGSFGQDSYWYSTVSFSSNVPHRTDSYTWRVSQSLKEHLKNNRYATKLGSWSKNGTPDPYHTYAYVNNSSNLTVNNTGKVILFYDWNGGATMDHSAFFVGNNDGSWCDYEAGLQGDLIDQHTSRYNNRKRVLWRPDYRQDSSNLYTTRVYAFELPS